MAAIKRFIPLLALILLASCAPTESGVSDAAGGDQQVTEDSAPADPILTDAAVVATNIVPELPLRAEPVRQGTDFLRRIPIGEEVRTTGETRQDGDFSFLRVVDRDEVIGWVDERFVVAGYEAAAYVGDSFLYDEADPASLLPSLRMPQLTILAVDRQDPGADYFPAAWFDEERGIIRREFAKASDVSAADADVTVAQVVRTLEGLENPDAQRAVLENTPSSSSIFAPLVASMREELGMQAQDPPRDATDTDTDTDTDRSSDTAEPAEATGADDSAEDAGASGSSAESDTPDGAPAVGDAADILKAQEDLYGLDLEAVSGEYEVLTFVGPEDSEVYAPVYDKPAADAVEVAVASEDTEVLGRTTAELQITAFGTQYWYVLRSGDSVVWAPAQSVSVVDAGAD